MDTPVPTNVPFGVRGSGLGARTITSNPPAPSPQPPARVRRPAVAGYFYPEAAEELAVAVDALFDDAAAEPVSARALIVPHGAFAMPDG